MGLTYFKRYRMERDLRGEPPRAVSPPPGYALAPWSAELLIEHSEAKFASFRWEIDAYVFPCLGDREGCQRLMREIVARDGFLPEATWLALRVGDGSPTPCGTIQGLTNAQGIGSIQNVGVMPEHRGVGLGRALLLAALAGFRAAGMRKVTLEVTSQNEPAVELYERLGFRRVRTLYKGVEVAISR